MRIVTLQRSDHRHPNTQVNFTYILFGPAHWCPLSVMVANHFKQPPSFRARTSHTDLRLRSSKFIPHNVPHRKMIWSVC